MLLLLAIVLTGIFCGFVFSGSKHKNVEFTNGEVLLSPLINIVITHKNRFLRLTKLLTRLQRIADENNDYNLKIIVCDHNSDSLSASSTKEFLKFWTHETGIDSIYHKVLDSEEKKSSFKKALSIQQGIDLIEVSKSIIFICDVDMYFPLNILSTIRKETIEKKTFYAPISFIFHSKEFSDFHLTKGTPRKGGMPSSQTYFVGNSSDENQEEGYWRADGFGNLAVYNSDWKNAGDVIGEFSHKTKWGGEDDHIMFHLKAQGLELIRKRLQGFYHLWHPKGDWHE